MRFEQHTPVQLKSEYPPGSQMTLVPGFVGAGRICNWWVQVDIPQGYSSERLLFRRVIIPKILFRKVIIPKIFIPKGYYSKNFHPEGSGVATGWHGWTMSRGPGAKGALERETKRKRKKERKKRKQRMEKKKIGRKKKGKSILQVPDTGTRVLDNTGPFLRSSILSFWITPACS